VAIYNRDFPIDFSEPNMALRRAKTQAAAIAAMNAKLAGTAMGDPPPVLALIALDGTQRASVAARICPFDGSPLIVIGSQGDSSVGPLLCNSCARRYGLQTYLNPPGT
jgi:hypothetical protein